MWLIHCLVLAVGVGSLCQLIMLVMGVTDASPSLVDASRLNPRISLT